MSDQIIELNKHVGLLTDLVFKLLAQTTPALIGKSQIVKLLGWSANKFYYKKDVLIPYGLVKNSNWEMPLNGLFEYQKSQS